MRRLIAHLVGDYVVQSDWMAQTKTKSSKSAAAHATSYAACFLTETRDPRALAVIGGTHYMIDHWRLARYVVWAKNQVAPAEFRYTLEGAQWHGYGPRPASDNWLTGWLLFIADNTMHLMINEWALNRWGQKE